jgi:Cytochrome P460
MTTLNRRRSFWFAMAALIGAVGLGTAATFPPMEEVDGAGQLPRYVNGGELVRPSDYRRWVFVGASLGLTYSPSPAMAGRQMFHHTYLAPRAYDAYLRTGDFPDKTMLVLELYDADQKAEPATGGWFESQRRAVEVAVKDRQRFPDCGWAYFTFSQGGRDATSATPFPASAGCVGCHREHAAHDNVFTQFYPILRERS